MWSEQTRVPDYDYYNDDVDTLIKSPANCFNYWWCCVFLVFVLRYALPQQRTWFNVDDDHNHKNHRWWWWWWRSTPLRYWCAILLWWQTLIYTRTHTQTHIPVQILVMQSNIMYNNITIHSHALRLSPLLVLSYFLSLSLSLHFCWEHHYDTILPFVLLFWFLPLAVLLLPVIPLFFFWYFSICVDTRLF